MGEFQGKDRGAALYPKGRLPGTALQNARAGVDRACMRVMKLLSLVCLLAASCAFAADPPPAADASKAAEPAPPAATEPAASPPATDVPADKETIPADREAEITPRLPELTVDDELVWLNADSARFFAFKRLPAKAAKPQGAILIVPGPRAFIDQHPGTTQLREIPAAGGWLTLALQVPLQAEVAPEQAPAPASDATPPTPANAPVDPLCARITAALAFVDATKPPLIALVAEGESADRAQACFADGFPPNVRAFAAVGRWRGKLDGLKVPSIEFVPALDPVAIREADRRRKTARQPNTPPHRRVDIDAADRAFKGGEVDVAKRLRGWLEKLPPPPALPKDAQPPPAVKS